MQDGVNAADNWVSENFSNGIKKNMKQLAIAR